jgi:hypothetical protein
MDMDPGYKASCKVLHSFSASIACTSLSLGTLLVQVARNASNHSNQAAGATIVDLSGLFLEAPDPCIYTLWVSRVSTPSLFSITCACEHLRRHLIARERVVVTLFNDLGDEGDGEGEGEAGTYLVVLKEVDGKQQCIPVNFSGKEKGAMKQRIQDSKSSQTTEKLE